MRFALEDEVAWPREVVFKAHRDHLPEVAEYVPNVTSVETISRVEEPGGLVRLENLWHGARSDIPMLLRPFIGNDALSWLDRATWDIEKWQCDWEITLNALPEAVTARGKNVFREEDGETLIFLSGELIIHPQHLPAVGGFVPKKASEAIERFVVGMVKPNLKHANVAVARYLEDLEDE